MEQGVKVKNKIKENIIKNKKPLKPAALKVFLGLTIFYFVAVASTTSYIDNQAKSIVTNEQRETLLKIISIDKSEKFLSDNFNQNYSDESYSEDYKLLENFKLKMKKDFDDLFKNDTYVRSNFKEYNGNYEKFLNDFKNSYSYNEFFLKYYYVTKMESENIENNNYNMTYYIDKVLNNNLAKLFFREKIIKNNLKEKDYNKIPLIIEYKNIVNSEDYKKKYNNLFFDIFNGKDYVNSYVAKHNIISHQFDNIYSKFILYSTYQNDSYKTKNYNFNEIKKYKDLNHIEDKKTNDRVNFLINNFVSDPDKVFLLKTIDFENKNDPYVKNTFMIENVRINYLNLKNEIYKIRNQNKKQFSEFNYKAYYYLDMPFVFAKYFFSYYIPYDIKSGESPLFDKDVKIYTSNVTLDPVNLFLSGFNEGFKNDKSFNNYYNEIGTPERYKDKVEYFKYSGLN